MRSFRSSRLVKSVAVAAAAIGLAAGVAGTAGAATSPWLSGSQMPQSSYFHWQPALQHKITTTGEFQGLFTCGIGDPTRELHTSSVTLVPSFTKARHVVGGQVLLHFSSTAKAKAALARIQSDYAHCVNRLDQHFDMVTNKHVHASVVKTAWLPGGVSYLTEIRNSLGRPAEASDLSSDAQEFFVQRGNTISMVDIQGTNSHLDVATGSLNVLKAMAARLG